MTALLLALAFVLIVVGAIGFTNAVEWLGFRLGLAAGAIGALLAAVGTALPESLIPVIALASGGGEEARLIAIGAIIGAPFLLGTLAMLLVAGAALGFQGRRAERGKRVEPDQATARRDLRAFLLVFPFAIVLGAIGPSTGVRVAAAIAFIAAYAFYVWRTVRGGGEATEEAELTALFFDPSKNDPPSVLQIVLQFLVSLGAIVAGAELFVTEVEALAVSLGVSILILALVLAPLATELPEKANSVLWIREGKDSLAVGNITGALVFQSTIPIALGLLLTDWELDRYAIAAAVVGLIGGAVALVAVRRRAFGGTTSIAWAALLVAFAVFIAVA